MIRLVQSVCSGSVLDCREDFLRGIGRSAPASYRRTQNNYQYKAIISTIEMMAV